MISPRAYFVFTPLLASTSTGTLEPSAVVEPVRGAGRSWWKFDVVIRHSWFSRWLSHAENAKTDMEFIQGTALSVDFDEKLVKVRPSVEFITSGKNLHVPYDKVHIFLL